MGWAGPELPWKSVAMNSSLRASVGQHHTKICKELSNSKNLVFNVKKLLNDDVDLTPWLRGGRSNASGKRKGLVDLGPR